MSSSLAGRANFPRMTRGIAALVAATLVAAGCGLLNDIGRQARVAVYGRNAVAAEAWVVVRPITDPPNAVGFTMGIGVACFEAPIGSELVTTDRSPSQGGQVTGVIATLDEAVEPIWIDVAADGSLTTGEGVPVWWSDPPSPC